MKSIPLFGSGTTGKSRVVTRQRRLNVYYENRPDGDKSKVAIYGTPGLNPMFTVGTSPFRALSGDANYLYAVANNQFLQVNPVTGATLASGPVNSSATLATIQTSPTQVVVVDGLTGYYFNIKTQTFQPIVPWQAQGARTVTFCSGFFVAEQPGTQTFWVSNAFDGSTWNALAFADAASNEDTILAADELNGILIIFAGQHQEFWQNVGATPQPFQPILSAYNEWGLAAVFSRAHADQSIIFLGITKQGIVQLVKLSNYSPQVISDADTEYIWNRFSTVSDAVCLTYQQDHHIMYQITFPTANRSWIYDNSTGILSEVQTGNSLSPTRHWGNLSTYAAGKNFISDYQTNQIYEMSSSLYTDNGQMIVREIVTRHVLSNFNRIRVNLLYLDMETGVGLTTGQGINPMVSCEHSRDNGRTWSGQRWCPLGAQGQYLNRVSWRRFGSARDHVFRIRMTDPVKFVITEGAIKLSERQPAARLG